MYPNASTIGIIAPAGKLRPDAFDAGVAFLRASGKQLKFGSYVNGPTPAHYLAAAAEDRAWDLMDLWFQPEIDLLLPTRGGFGCAHLLPLLDWPAMRSRPDMPLAGYSDITALHWAMEACRAGHPLAAPMLGRLKSAAACAYTLRYHRAAFAPEEYEILPPPDSHAGADGRVDSGDGGDVGADVGDDVGDDGGADDRPTPIPGACHTGYTVLKAGSATGLPLPGNLSVAASLCGTPWLPNATGRILILEDVNEPLYKLDRMLTTLVQNGLFAQCAGVIFGSFSGCAPAAELMPLLRWMSEAVNGPVLAGFAFGHDMPFVTLDFHRPMHIDGGRVFITGTPASS